MPGTGAAVDPVVGRGWGRQDWAVFSQIPYRCKVSTRTALIDPNGLWSHFTVKKTEAEKEKVTCLKSSS